MENVDGDIIEPPRKLELDYDMLVWSNYFGCLNALLEKLIVIS